MGYPSGDPTESDLLKLLDKCPGLRGWSLSMRTIRAYKYFPQSRVIIDGDSVRHVLANDNVKGPGLVCDATDLRRMDDFAAVITLVVRITDYSLHEILHSRHSSRFQHLETLKICWYSQRTLCDKCLNGIKRLFRTDDIRVIPQFRVTSGLCVCEDSEMLHPE